MPRNYPKLPRCPSAVLTVVRYKTIADNEVFFFTYELQSSMQFVDQGWRLVDIKLPKYHAPCMDSVVMESIQGPSLHVFTPRIRLMVQCARIQKKMKLSELSQHMSMSSKDLRDIEEGISFPSNNTLERLQRILCVQLIPVTQKCI